MTNKKTIDVDPKRINGFTMNVLGCILVICDDGTTAATLRRVNERVNPASVGIPLSDLEAFLALEHFGLISGQGTRRMIPLLTNPFQGRKSGISPTGHNNERQGEGLGGRPC